MKNLYFCFQIFTNLRSSHQSLEVSKIKKNKKNFEKKIGHLPLFIIDDQNYF